MRAAARPWSRVRRIAVAISWPSMTSKSPTEAQGIELEVGVPPGLPLADRRGRGARSRRRSSPGPSRAGRKPSIIEPANVVSRFMAFGPRGEWEWEGEWSRVVSGEWRVEVGESSPSIDKCDRVTSGVAATGDSPLEATRHSPSTVMTTFPVSVPAPPTVLASRNFSASTAESSGKVRPTVGLSWPSSTQRMMSPAQACCSSGVALNMAKPSSAQFLG